MCKISQEQRKEIGKGRRRRRRKLTDLNSDAFSLLCSIAYPTALKRQLLSAGMTLRTSTPPSSIFIAFSSSALAVFSISFVLLAYRKSILKKITDWAIQQQQQSLELCNNSSNHLGYLCNNNKSNPFFFSFFFFFFFFCRCFILLLLFGSVWNDELFDVIKELSNNS
jgi:hypothetical protein